MNLLTKSSTKGKLSPCPNVAMPMYTEYFEKRKGASRDSTCEEIDCEDSKHPEILKNDGTIIFFSTIKMMLSPASVYANTIMRIRF